MVKPEEISDMASKIIGSGRTAQNDAVEADEGDTGESDYNCPACGAQLNVRANPPKETPE